MSPFQLHMSAMGEGAVFCSVDCHHGRFGTALPCDALARDAFGRASQLQLPLIITPGRNLQSQTRQSSRKT
jgi:hypothetical protein